MSKLKCIYAGGNVVNQGGGATVGQSDLRFLMPTPYLLQLATFCEK